MPTGSGVPVIPQAQLQIGPAGWWRPEADNPPGNRVIVKPGTAYRGTFAVVNQAAAQPTSGFASVTLFGTKRYDMVYIDSAGSVQVAQGVQVALGAPLFDGAPGRPNGPPLPPGNPVAYVHVDEAGAVTVDVVDVFQINGFVSLQRDLDGYLVDKGPTGGAPSGLSIDVSALFVTDTRILSVAGIGSVVPDSGGSSTQAGVITSAPLNYVHLLDEKRDQIKHSTGAEMFGRVTEVVGVWTLSFYYLDGTGAEQTMNPATDTAGPAPTDLRLAGVPRSYSKNDPARPLFPSSLARLADQVAGDIPYATTTSDGKVRLAPADGVIATQVVQADDPRLAAATTSRRGTVELATDGEALAGRVVQGNDSRLVAAPTSVPVGMVIAWYRPTIAIPFPSDFVVCDGSVVVDAGSIFNGFAVPDLRNRFIRGYAGVLGSYPPAPVAGVDSHGHTVNSHNHGGDTQSTSPGTDSQGAHSHTGVTGATGPNTPLTAFGGGVNTGTNSHTHTISGDGGHSHSVDSHKHNLDSDSPGTSGAANVPAYVGLLQIIKIK